MSSKRPNNQLELLTSLITESLDTIAGDDGGKRREYGFTSAYAQTAARSFNGTWTVVEHTVAGVPFAENFVNDSMGGAQVSNLAYEASYEFSGAICIKRMAISGEIEEEAGRSQYEYRMNLVLNREIRGETLAVKPLIGYQYTLIDGQPTAIRDLPRQTEWITSAFRFEGDALILECGSDLKKLRRLA
jgi:hypothetical protein